jgi:hypothetical protein
MRRSGLALALIASLALLVVAGGCGSRKSTLGPDLPPETSVYIQGTVDPVSHRVHLYWFGSDPDGYVVAYQMRFVPDRGNPNPKWDTLYCALPGRCTDSTFTLITGDSALIHTQFEIRAMDDKGLVDPTPAIQPLALTNLAPRVHITNPLHVSDSTFASATFSWDVDDPDGGGPGLRYRIWLDGNHATYDSTTANTFTVPSARFLQGGAYRPGYRSLYLQAIDDGERSGPVDSMKWFVRAPARRDPLHRSVLVIDDSRSTAQNNQSVDTLYVQTFRRNLYPDSCFVIQRLQYSNPFRSTGDVAQTLKLFDAVVWYWGYDFHNPSDFASNTTLNTYQDVVGDYITQGGRILLEGLYLIEGRATFGALREDFITRYLNCRAMVLQFNTLFPDSTVGLSTPQSGLRLRSRLNAYADAPFQMTALPGIQSQSPGLRGFIPNDTTQVAYWALHGQIADLDSTYYRGALDVPLAMSSSSYGGRLIVLTMPSRSLIAPASQPFNKRPLALLLFGPQGLVAP